MSEIEERPDGSQLQEPAQELAKQGAQPPGEQPAAKPSKESAAQPTTPPVADSSLPRRSRSESREKSGAGRKWIGIALVVLVVAGLAVGGYFLYQQAAAKRVASEQLDEAITLVERADATVIEVDEVVRAEVDGDLAERATSALADLPNAVSDLEGALVLLESAIPDQPEERAEEAMALQGSAQARLAMLEHAEVVLDANVKAAESIGSANEGWDKILAAEKTADQAVAEYNKLTDEAVKKSRELTVSASNEITSGKKLLEEAQTAFPEADFSPFIEYSDAKLAVLELSIKADDAFVAGNKAEANKISDQYNEEEKKLVEKAKELPSSPNAVIAAAYESLAGSATVEYFDAREQATDADAELMKASTPQE